MGQKRQLNGRSRLSRAPSKPTSSSKVSLQAATVAAYTLPWVLLFIRGGHGFEKGCEPLVKACPPGAYERPSGRGTQRKQATDPNCPDFTQSKSHGYSLGRGQQSHPLLRTRHRLSQRCRRRLPCSHCYIMKKKKKQMGPNSPLTFLNLWQGRELQPYRSRHYKGREGKCQDPRVLAGFLERRNKLIPGYCWIRRAPSKTKQKQPLSPERERKPRPSGVKAEAPHSDDHISQNRISIFPFLFSLFPISQSFRAGGLKCNSLCQHASKVFIKIHRNGSKLKFCIYCNGFSLLNFFFKKYICIFIYFLEYSSC